MPEESPSHPSGTLQRLERALSGDREEEGQLFAELTSTLVSVARAHPLMSRAAAYGTPEDFAQQALERVLRSGALRGFKDPGRGAFRRFMVTVLDGAIVDALRRQSSMKRGPASEIRSLDVTGMEYHVVDAHNPTPTAAAKLSEIREMCASILEGREAQVWQLVGIEERSAVEVAQMLGVTADAVRGVYRRARLQLDATLDLRGP